MSTPTQLTQTLTEELTWYRRAMEWLDSPAIRPALPRHPQLADPAPLEPQWRAVLEDQVDDLLEIVEHLVNSIQPDLPWAASYLFDPIIGGGGRERLQQSFRSSEAWRVWEAFLGASDRYVELAQLLEHTRRRPGRPPRSVATLTTVIVHGTGAQNVDWWREVPHQRNFWHYIHSITKNCVRQGQEFRWSGGWVDQARWDAAELFLNWWEQLRRPRLRVIAHSHGANVVWYAAAQEPALKIDTFISLGTPICVGYPLRLGQISRIENVYSEYDFVQTMGARAAARRGEGRTLPDSVKVTNHHVPFWNPKVRTRRVGHPDLHEEQVWQDNDLHKLL